MTPFAVADPWADCLPADLDRLLDADPAAVEAWARHWYNEQTGPVADRVVLFGAGGLGREVGRALAGRGLRPLALSDNRPALWGQRLDGLDVLPPAEAVRRFGCDAAFVVTIFTPGPGRVFGQVRDQLRGLGCKTVVPFAGLAWKFPELFLPRYCIDLPHKVTVQAEAIRAAWDLWADDLSRQEYLAQLRWRLLLDFDVFKQDEETYFPADLVDRCAGACFVDCGAFDGDTVRAFFDWQPDFRSIVAFEPDPVNYRRLTAWHAGLPESVGQRLTLHPYAVGSRRQKLRFAATGCMAAAVSDAGTVEVDCVSLDEVLAGRAVTFLKMDIEGAELDALAGAAETIRRCRPVLAVCAYHCQDHLWQIPLQLAAQAPGYDLFLRRHGDATGEVVCFGTPREQ